MTDTEGNGVQLSSGVPQVRRAQRQQRPAPTTMMDLHAPPRLPPGPHRLHPRRRHTRPLRQLCGVVSAKRWRGKGLLVLASVLRGAPPPTRPAPARRKSQRRRTSPLPSRRTDARAHLARNRASQHAPDAEGMECAAGGAAGRNARSRSILSSGFFCSNRLMRSRAVGEMELGKL